MRNTTRCTCRVLLVLLVGILCAGGWSASADIGQDLNRVPVPASPLTAADPFNPEAGLSWTNDQQPPPKDRLGRFVYLPSSNTRPYVSFFTISGRSCGYLYVDSDANLPRAGARIRISADTSVKLSVLQVNTNGKPAPGRGVAASRLYAYLCAEDGQYHRMDGGAGRWTYDLWRQAETGLPTYVDTGVVAAPHFIEIPKTGASFGEQSHPCADRSDWRSLDHQLTCQNYRDNAKDRNWCTDLGYIDPSILNPRNVSSKIQWDVPAYVACPTACRMCLTCKVNMTTVDPGTLQNRRNQNIVIDGCKVGYDCVNIKGAPLMEDGKLTPTEFDRLKAEDPTAKRNYVPIPPFSSALTDYFKELHYHCKLSPYNAPSLEQVRNVVDVEPGTIFETSYMIRVFSATPHSLVRYTLDGSDPRHDHGYLVSSGDVVDLRQSGQMKALAYLDPATHVAIRHSRIVTLPYIRIRIGPPLFKISSVGHYRRAWAQVQAECSVNSSWVSSLPSSDFEVVRSNGCPQSQWATTNNLNIARHQAWSFALPLKPRRAFQPLPLTQVSGVIGVAADGVPIWAPPPSATDEAFALELLEADACGGLAMSIRQVCEGGKCLFETEHHGQYHYRGLPRCLDKGREADGHSPVLAVMFDGVPLYGPRDVGGSVPQNLDVCGGHVDAGRPWYHYHASDKYPYTVGCLSGCLDAQTLLPANAHLASMLTEACTPAEVQPRFEGWRGSSSWVAEPSVSEAALLLSGSYEGSVSIEFTCPMHPQGLAYLRFNTHGEDPAVGGAANDGFAVGSMRIIVSDMAQVRARCEAPNMEPSTVRDTQSITVHPVDYNPHWAATVGFWNLTDVSNFWRSFDAARSAVQGGCSEVHATHIEPAYARDLSSGLGDLLLVPPDCKAGRAEWDVEIEAQPSLASIYGVHRGIPGVLLDSSAAINGLQQRSASVQQLVETQRLPLEQLTVEVWASLAEGREGALAGVIFKTSGFLGKGWYLGWEADSSATQTSVSPALDTVTFLLTLSTEASDNFGRGGLATVRATYPRMLVGQHWVHVAGTYDGHHLALYINGTLAATERACRRDFCGRITYPVPDGTYVLNNLYFGIGALEFNGRKLRHQGYIALVRVLAQAVGETVLRAGAERLLLPLALSWCPPGSAGPYDGLKPCVECEAGYYAALQGQIRCQPCPIGYYSDTLGSDVCKQCPNGALTRSEGTDSSAKCVGPDLCKSLQHNCDTFALCTSTDGSFECTCKPGYYGDGIDCDAACGDGLRVHGETHACFRVCRPRTLTRSSLAPCAACVACGAWQCDDGNGLSSDGCSSQCSIEEGFTCSARQGRPDECSCNLDAAACCVRAYGKCITSTDKTCGAECLGNLTSCMRRAQLQPSAAPGLSTVPASSEAGAAGVAGATSRSAATLLINETAWSLAAGKQCDRGLMKGCRQGLVACQNREAQRTVMLQDQLPEVLTSGASSSATGQRSSSREQVVCSSGTSNCLDSYVECMRVTACTDKS